MKNGYYITSSGEKTVIEAGTKTVHCSNNQLKELVLPEGIKEVYCDDLLFDARKYIDDDNVSGNGLR